MNEITPFFQSWGFWLILGLFIGAIFGLLVAALRVVSDQASIDEEWREAMMELRNGWRRSE